MEKLPTNPPFKLVAKRLKEHFASDASEELWLNELELLRCGEKEIIPQLVHKVMDKLPKAFLRMTKEDRERLGIRYFTKALIDPQQRLDIRKARPKTLSAAMELALTTENATKEDAYLQARYAKGSQVTSPVGRRLLHREPEWSSVRAAKKEVARTKDGVEAMVDEHARNQP